MDKPQNEYDVLQNAFGEVLFAVRARMGNASTPRLVYDGHNQAIFYRTPKQPMLLDKIPHNVSQALLKVQKVLFVEVHDQSIIREYIAPLELVAHLPSIR